MLKQKNADMTVIDEYKTSQNCANCFKSLYKYDPNSTPKRTDKTNYSKLRHCFECGHVIHRDQNGSRNITMLFEKQLAAQIRPKQFCRGNQADGIDICLFYYEIQNIVDQFCKF